MGRYVAAPNKELLYMAWEMSLELTVGMMLSQPNKGPFSHCGIYVMQHEGTRTVQIIAYSSLLGDIVSLRIYMYIHEKYPHHYGSYWYIGRMANSILGYFIQDSVEAPNNPFT